ncbi:hypothetical protein ABEB22_02420 [Thioclava sp. 'Guangxiensis']|uniref:hypothetical protein n=1 Tax=Thioclava sp. 'Guangxiensis' TaxID=3149044 RepID=UPI003877DB70
MPPLSLTRLYDTSAFAVDHHQGDGDALVLSFSSIGHDATRLPSPEFVASAIGHRQGGNRRALFFMDAARSWGNTPLFPEIVRRAYAHACAQRPVRQLIALGLSMGAYQALIAAQILPVDTVLAFGPQYSLELAANRREWQPWVARIDQPLWPIAPLPAAPCQTFLVHALRDDLDHAQSFRPARGVDHILFDDLDHSSLLPHLKRRGCLDGVIDAAVAQDRRRMLRILQSAGGRRREESVLQAGSPPAQRQETQERMRKSDL